jgi:hypothetical protein
LNHGGRRGLDARHEIAMQKGRIMKEDDPNKKETLCLSCPIQCICKGSLLFVDGYCPLSTRKESKSMKESHRWSRYMRRVTGKKRLLFEAKKAKRIHKLREFYRANYVRGNNDGSFVGWIRNELDAAQVREKEEKGE